MRLFVGVELDEAVRRRTARLAEALRTDLERTHQFHARWIDPANLHLTLAFIGEVDEETGESMRAALERPFALSSFDVHLGGFGAFPPSGAPRVVWLGVNSGAAPLGQLHQEVEARLQPIGYAPERRPYSAHLTLARVKDVPRGRYGAIRGTLKESPADAGSFVAGHVTLFRSRLSPKGANHEALLRVPLM
jgi:2'-5' RNA ligase